MKHILVWKLKHNSWKKYSKTCKQQTRIIIPNMTYKRLCRMNNMQSGKIKDSLFM